MKYTAPTLIGKKADVPLWKKLLLRSAVQTLYYSADHYDKDLRVIWIEALRLGKMQCFPCAIKEGDHVYAFHDMKSYDTDAKNREFIKKWNECVTPDNIGKDFDVLELDEGEFFDLYSGYKAMVRTQEIHEAELILGEAPEPKPENDGADESKKVE